MLATSEGTLLSVRSIIVGILAALCIGTHAFADISFDRIPMQDGPPVLMIKGEFVLGDDPAKLSREVAATGAKVVSFNSNGGNVVAAIAYGRMIRALGLSTFQLRSSQCASACALAFVGGVIRKAEPGSIGVHQSSFAPETAIDGQTAVAAVQALTAQIMGYLVEMGVDPQLLQLSLSVPSDDMRYLTASEMASYKVTVDGPISADVASTMGQATPTVTPQVKTRPAAATPEDRALAFMARYHDAWSHPNSEALGFMDRAYADTITFYGKSASKADVLADKRKFADRWPRRAYSVRFGTEHAYCGSVCTVSGVVDWFAESPERGKMSSGSAEFRLVWDATSERITSEIGKVLATDRNAIEPTRILDQWQTENGNCRGGSGDSDETWKACGRRDDIGKKLEAIGWCYGRPGEAGYQMDWHRCDAADSTQVAASNVDTSSSVPRLNPSDYPAREIFKGKTRLPDFKKRDRDFNSFRTRIRDGMREGPNFAGRYSVIQIGCGTGCSFVIVGDNKTGRPMNFPRGGEDNMYLELRHQLDSRLLIAQWANYDGGKCYIEFFDFDGASWNVLKKIEVGVTEACYNDIEKNLK